VARSNAKDRIWRGQPLSLPAGASRVRCRDHEALDELAWAYFYSRPASRKIKKPDFHIDAVLVAGADDNYRSLGENWPDSRYLVISLSGDVLPNRRHGQIRVIRDWRCRYDLQTGTFDIPSDFKENNAKAIALNSE
jgi:hypothetical protein